MPRARSVPVDERSVSAFLTLNRIGKRYGATQVVRNVSLGIEPGCFLTLLGPSGSGKTTLLMIIAGFVAPSGGQVLLDDRDITHLPPDKRAFGMVFQGYALFPHMTVGENVAFALKVRHRPSSEIQAAVRRALDMVQMTHFADRLPRQLSGGQQQRVAIARALSFGPKLLLLDEPLSALDKKLRLDVQTELRDLHKRLGVTFLCVTHDQEEALSLSDQIAILRDGRVEQVGSPHDLYERPGSRFVAEFLGRSNFLPVTVTDVQPGRVNYTCGDRHLVKLGDAPMLNPMDAVTLALRPESIQLSAVPLSGERNVVEGLVQSASYAGAMQHVVVTTRLGPQVTATVPVIPGEAPLCSGTPVWLNWDAQAGVMMRDG
jgi:putative spermidine/putrescine transport system ATP-binding protein